MSENLPFETVGLVRRVNFNTLVIIAGRAVSLVLSAGTSVLLVRYLGNEQLGQYGAVYAYVALFEWIAIFGMWQILQREASKQRERAGEILLTGSATVLVFSLLAFSLALIIAPFLKYDGGLRWLVVIAAVDTLLLSSLRSFGIIFQVDLRQSYTVSISTVRQVLWLIVLVTFTWLKANLIAVVFGRLTCSIVEAVILFSCAARFMRLRWPQDWSLAIRIVRESWPIALSSLFIGIYHRVDQIMLHRLASAKDLGYYVAAVNLTELFSVLPVALMSSAFPILCQVVDQPGRFARYLEFCYRYLMAAVFGICIAVSFGAFPLVRLLYGEDFQPSGSILAVLIWSEVSVFFGVVISNGLIALGLQGYTTLTTAVGALTNIGLNLVFIPRWRGIGAAWATVISYSLTGMLLFAVFPETRRIATQGLTWVLKCLVLSIVIVGALWFVPLSTISQALIGLGAYFTGIVLTGIVSKADYKKLLRSMT